MLTAGLTSGLTDIQNDKYLQVLKQNPEVSKIGDLSDSNTLLNLNMPDTRQKITDGFHQGVAQLPAPAKDAATTEFTKEQGDYSNKITHAFSDSLRSIFLISSGLMLAAAVLVFSIKERPLKAAKADQTPGVA